MTAKNNDKKGFGAFDDLVSDVSNEIETLAQKDSSVAEPRDKPQEDSSPSNMAAIPTITSGGDKGGIPWGWITFGLFVVFVIILGLGGEKVEEPTAPETTFEEPFVPPIDEAEVPADEQAPSDSVASTNPEEQPPVGVGLVFSYNQIRYCLSEDIRLSAIKDALDKFSQFEVKHFNAEVDDYNSRCSNFRYRSGALEIVRAEVNPLHSTLVLEGLHRLDSWRGNVPQPAKAEHKLIEMAKDIPSEPIVSDSINSELSPDERSSIESVCNGEKLLYGPAAYDKCLANQKSKLANSSSPPDLSMFNSEEISSIETVCNGQKLLYGPAAYYKCLGEQKAKLINVSAPDLSDLSAEEQSSIESICNGEKLLYGPAAYYKCLSSQKTQLVTGPSVPDMSSLTADERSSIESVCGGQKLLYGPAAYYKCLQLQVRKLNR